MSIVQVSGLRKSYGDNVVVQDVSFAVEEGEIFGILGPNGAGKTTVVECLEGLRVPDSGYIRLAGLDPQRDRTAMTEVLGVQLQSSELQPKITVVEALELYSAFYRDPLDWRELADRLSLGSVLRQRFGKLSGGQRQRLFIALALLGRPKVAVFDELTTALDPRGRRETWALIEDVCRSGVTVLLVTHFMEEAQRLCDRIAVLDHGRLVAVDTPAGLISRSEQPTVISFVPSRPLSHAELRALPGAVSVAEHGGHVTITGTDETANAVVALLAAGGVTAARLRVADATLDDAFLDLTGTSPEGAN
jgi:ABC-2 type transport system ATP-binding protein